MAIKTLTSSDVTILKNGVPVGCSQSADFSLNTDIKEATCQASGSWRTIAVGRKSWSGSFQAIYRTFSTTAEQDANVTFKSMFTDFVAGAEVELEFNIDGERFGGTGYVTELSFGKPEDDIVTYNVSIEGNGEFAALV